MATTAGPATTRTRPATYSPASATSRPPVGVAMLVQFCAAVSRNPAVRDWDRPEARFGHVAATGLAIHRGVAYRRNDGLKSPWRGRPVPGLGKGHQGDGRRPGSAASAGPSKDGMLGRRGGPGRQTRGRYALFFTWSDDAPVKDWAGARRAEGTAFVVLGDFNNRLMVTSRSRAS